MNMTRFDEIMLQFFTVCVVGFTGFLVLSGVFSHEIAVGIVRFFFIGSAAVGITYGLVRLTQRLAAHGLKLDIMRALVLKKSNEAAFGIRDMDSGLVLNYASGSAQYFTKHRTPRAEIPCDTPPVIPENIGVIESLPLLCKCDSVLIAGGKGAGKTNLAFHLAENQMKSGCEVVVIDPKPQFDQGKWFGAKVIGANHNYAEITSFLSDLTSVMKDDRKQVRLWIDEITVLNMQIKRFSSLWLPVLIEGREYGKFVSIIGQSKTAGSVGLEGRYDLLDCFDAIAVCRHNKASDERFTEIELAGEGMVIGTAPEKFRLIGYHGTQYGSTSVRNAFTPGNHEADDVSERTEGCTSESVLSKLVGMIPFFSERLPENKGCTDFIETANGRHAAIIRLYRQGKSVSEIAKIVYGGSGKKIGGKQKELVQKVIEKHV